MKIILGFIWMGLIFSCQKTTIPLKPEILTAEYKIITHSEYERGYKIFMIVTNLPKTFSIKGIVFQNRNFELIHFTKMSENEIFIEQYFPIQSKQIYNFSPPKADSRSDGIIFEINGIDYFYEIKFTIK